MPWVTGNNIAMQLLSKKLTGWALVVHTFNPSTWEALAGLGGRGRWVSEFKASVVYRVSS